MLWLLLSILTLVVLSAVLWPVWRGARDVPADPITAIYRAQLTEIEGDVRRGVLSEAEAKASRAEVARRLIAAEAEPPRRSAGSVGPGGRPAVAAALLGIAGVAALGFYQGIGTPSLPDQPIADRLAGPVEENSVDLLIAKVEERLRQAPDDGEGWSVIAPVYMRLGRYLEAAEAYRNALRLLGEDAQRLEGYGAATVAAANGIVSEAARTAFARAVALDANRVESRFWLAAAAEQDGRRDDAARGYQEILDRSAADAPWRPTVEARLAALTGKATVSAPGPTAADVEAASELSDEDRQAMIEGMVSGLAEKLKGDGKNLDGWLRLIRAYTVLQKRDLALKALSDAKVVLADDAAALASLEGLAKELGLGS
jgi:cytochrome c-type biogenesis protein CcmH